MKKVIKALAVVLSTAWYAALTFFCFVVFGTAIFWFADKLLSNDIVSCVILAIILIATTIFVGNHVKEKANKSEKNGGKEP